MPHRKPGRTKHRHTRLLEVPEELIPLQKLEENPDCALEVFSAIAFADEKLFLDPRGTAQQP